VLDLSDVDRVVKPGRQRIDLLFKWFPRLVIATVFLLIGRSKFAAQSVYVQIFEQIGFGVWFRYLTGAMQMAGALLVLIPRTFGIGILMIASTMVGAMIAWIFFLGSPGTAVIPGVLLAALVGVYCSSRPAARGPD
jgi:hypothetical protein